MPSQGSYSVSKDGGSCDWICQSEDAEILLDGGVFCGSWCHLALCVRFDIDVVPVP